MNKQAVRQIAAEMRAELPQIGRAERVLPGRTFLQLLHRNDSLQLIVGHPDYYPQLEDADQIAQAFGVAEYTEAQACTARIVSQDNISVKVRAIAYQWREAQLA